MSDADAPTGRVGVVIVAGGSGSRLGAAEPKAFVRVAGRTLLSYAVERVAQVPGLASLVMVAPATHLDAARADLIPLASADLVAVGARSADAAVVAGGAERSDSVRIGLERLDPACDLIVIHDAARCLTPAAVFERVIAAVRGGAAGAVPGLPVVDTIKVVDGEGVITGTPDRATLWAVQTPQGFDATVLRTAYASGLTATDDAALVEAIGHHVRVVEGDPLAFKITTPDDLARAELLVRALP